MAKRKRLSSDLLTNTEPELGSPPLSPRAPIAQVAGETSAHAALDEVVEEMTLARTRGKMIQEIALDDVKADHLLRDRMVSNEGEMENLKASLAARGQQTPIEVVLLADGRYGLISGWRRLQALKALHGDTGEARFAKVQALIKPINGASDSYVAMVEENEIRADLSFYERARLAMEASKIGVFPTPERAVQKLFAHVSSSKRSKIKSFILIHRELGDRLRFPAAIPERLGLALSKALSEDSTLASRLRTALGKAPATDAVVERQMIERAMRLPSTALASVNEVLPGVIFQEGKNRMVLSGPGVTAELQLALHDWLRTQG